jgi:AraC-like DNA-binding protein
MVNYKKFSDIEIFEGEISKHQYPWHFHDCFTIIIVEKGSIIYEFQDTTLKVEAAETLIIEPFKIHKNTISEPTVYKAIFLPQEYINHIKLNEIITLKLKHPYVTNTLVNFINKLELNHNKEELKKILLELFSFIHQLQLEKNFETKTEIQFIPKIDCDLTINELAKKAQLSKFHFQRKFKKSNGLTIGQLKQQEKTLKAKTLLEKGKLSTDVAFELGFFDQSHFIKYFKKMWAITPKKFK